MKRKKFFPMLWCMAVATAGFTTMSCSDDDGPAAPSKEIVQVDVYRAETNVFELQAQYKFTYDGKNRLSSVRTDYHSQEVSYNYGTNSVSYRWDGSDPEEGLFRTNFEAELRNGRVQVGSAKREQGTESETFNYTYFYNTQGYVTDATFGGSQSFSYTWGKQLLTISGRPSTYDAEYGYSKVTNDYSIDLNVLPYLVDTRTDVMMAMNAYAQLAGVLGTRYPNFLEDTDYSYSYHYDADGRLVQLTQTPANHDPNKQQTYWFILTYGE